MLIRSPSVAFAFEIDASPFEATDLRAVSSGPSTGRATPKRTPVAPCLSPAGPGAASTRVVMCAGSASPKRVLPSRPLDMIDRRSSVVAWQTSHPLAQAEGLSGPVSVSAQ
jgi:hypothetical protein